MIIKKFRILICFAVFLGVGYFLWSNILIFDDFHPSHEEFLETHVETQDAYNNTANTSQSGYHIHINLDKVTMYVYKNGKLLKTYPVSGGKSNTPTPLGSWKIVSKDTWGEGFGGAWMGFNVPCPT